MTPARVASHLAGASFVILCRSCEEADAALAEVRAWVAEAGLTLHPEKTHVGDCRQPGQGFEFVMPEACYATTVTDLKPAGACVAQEELEQARGQYPGQDGSLPRREPRTGDRRSQSDAAGLVQLLQAGASHHLCRSRWVHPKTTALDAIEAQEAVAHRVRHVDP